MYISLNDLKIQELEETRIITKNRMSDTIDFYYIG